MRRQHGQVVQGAGVKCYLQVPDSSPQPCHQQDLFLAVVPSSNPRSRFVNGNWSASSRLGFLTMLCLYEVFVSFVSVACLQTS